MLCAHKDIFIKNETHMLQVFTPGASRSDIESAIDKSVQERHGQSIAELLENEGKCVWGLKDPQLTEHLEALKQFMPDARFIIITRDARAVVRSYIENAWGLGTNCYTGALRWKREIEMQLAFEKELPENSLRLRYEDLITNQKQCLEKVSEFLDVPFDEAMLHYSKQKAFVSKNRQSINTFKAPDPAMITKWKAGLSDHQIRVINHVCGDLLAELGYELGDACEQVPAWLKAYYFIHQKIIGELQIQYRWRLGGYKSRYRKWVNNRSLKQS